MLSSHLRLPVPHKSKYSMPNVSLLPLYYMLESTKRHLITAQLNSHKCFSRSLSLPFGLHYSSIKFSVCMSPHRGINTRRASNVGECVEQEQTSIVGDQLNSFSHAVQNLNGENGKERQRRQKIGLANKGKVPWNKGKSHSEETRERIRQRTKEAMRDPKIRKKMAECPRAHSNQTKARIQSSLRKLWEERLKWKTLREKFLMSWAQSIAEAAKRGGAGQQELHWDSYDNMKREIALEQLQWAAEKAKEREMKRIRVERKAKATAEKMAILTLKRKKREQTAKVQEESKRKTRKKTKEEKEALADMQKLKLKEKLTKIHRKKPLSNQVTSRDLRAWEKFDLEFERERQWKHNEVSLADQIFAAKSKRAVCSHFP